MIAFYSADRIGYDAILLERFGIDTRTETSSKVVDLVYFLLREKVYSEFGLFREPVPPPPTYCQYSNRDIKLFHEAQTTWQKGLCKLDRWTEVNELDEYLTSPIKYLPAPEMEDA